MSDGYDLTEHADVYIVNFASQHIGRRTLFRMTIGDAMKVCACPETQGTANYGGQWMLCWTRNGLTELKPDEFIPDDGRFSEMFDRLGVTVLASRALLQSGEAFRRLAGQPATAAEAIPLHDLHAGNQRGARPTAIREPQPMIGQLSLFGVAS